MNESERGGEIDNGRGCEIHIDIPFGTFYIECTLGVRAGVLRGPRYSILG
jgi:hypothetical protein